jgi:hypothetical protein
MSNFHDMMCKTPINYLDELKQFYGPRYMNEYLVWNHKYRITANNKNKNSYFVLGKKQYDKLCKDHNYI